MKPTAKSLVLDLLSTVGGRAMPVRALVASAALFGIEENSVRVALARLFAAGTVERDERGAYRLGRRAEAVQAQVVSWRRLEDRVLPWSGGWVGVHTAALPRSERAVLRRSERALRFLGFRELLPGLEVRPDNLAGGAAEVRRRLVALGLPETAPVFALGELDPETDARARALWSSERLVASYRESAAAIAGSEKRIGKLTAPEAMAESFLLGGQVIRQLVLDPLLPESIVAGDERRALVAAMRRYDRIGRSHWRAFFGEYGLAGAQTPLDTRSHEGAESLVA